MMNLRILLFLLLNLSYLPVWPGQDSAATKRAEAQTFSIRVPQGDDWVIEVHPDTVIASRTSSSTLGLFGSDQVSKLVCTRVDGRYTFDGELLTQDEVIQDNCQRFTDLFERQLPRSGGALFFVFPPETLQCSGKEFIGVSRRYNWGDGWSEGRMYTFFPPDYATRKSYYRFVLMQALQAGVVVGWNSAGLDLVEVLTTFEPCDLVEVPKGDGGELLQAVAKGDSTTVQALLLNGFDPNASGIEGTPIVIAARKGDLSMVQLLLKSGARQDAEVSKNNGTPLHAAIEGGAMNVVQHLISTGADVNAPVKRHWTPLLEAVAVRADTSVISLLLRNGSKIDAADDEYGATPLYAASHLGSAELVSYLLDHGASRKIAGEWSPFFQAVSRKKVDVVKVMLDHGFDPNEHQSMGWSILMSAALTGDIDIVNALLEKGARIDASTERGTTALAVAINNQRTQVATFLMDKGADINTRTANGRTPLMLASAAGDTVMVRTLINRGANMKTEDEEGDTALDIADDADQDRIVEILEQAGADD